MSRFEQRLEQRLEDWADWYVKSYTGGLGYHSKSIQAQIMESGIFVRNPKIDGLQVNSNAEQIEKFLKAMEGQNPLMANVLKTHYFDPGSMRDKAQQLSISHTQFRVYVAMAKQWIAGCITGYQKKAA